MTDLDVIYSVLDTLRRQMDLDRPDPDELSPDRWQVSRNRLDNMLAMLVDEGYVTGVTVTDGNDGRRVTLDCPRITLRGLEWHEVRAQMISLTTC